MYMYVCVHVCMYMCMYMYAHLAASKEGEGAYGNAAGGGEG